MTLCTLLIPTLRRQRQPDFEVKVSMVYTVSSRSASPSYIVRTYLKITLTKTKKKKTWQHCSKYQIPIVGENFKDKTKGAKKNKTSKRIHSLASLPMDLLCVTFAGLRDAQRAEKTLLEECPPVSGRD